MKLSHLDVVAGIEALASPHPWSWNQFEESLSTHRCFTLLEGKKIIGHAVVSIIFSGIDGEAELLNIAVHPKYQGQGLGGELLQHCLQQLNGRVGKLFLEVRASNARAIQLYLKSGFKEVGTRSNYYQLDSGVREDALIMVLEGIR